MLELLNRLCSYKSIADFTGDPACPYGEENGKALDFMLSTCKKFGFRTENLNNKVGFAEIGDGDSIIGVLVHLDVVPAGDGWHYEPFAATLDGDRIYGRGVIDDKGPAVACIYAIKDILDSGAALDKRIRIIFGLAEESGDWEDMAYYVKNEKLPVAGFTPDAHFPAIYAEKGIFHFKLSMPLSDSGFSSISGGQAVNMVCDRAKAVVSATGKVIESSGKAAHGSTPWEGRNALTSLMEEAGMEEGCCKLADFYNSCIGNDFHGERLGIYFKDDASGEISVNAGKIETANDVVTLYVDARYPVTLPLAEICKGLDGICDKWGLTWEMTGQQDPVYMDRNGDTISKLLDVYHELTGLEGEPELIGGGTYARAMSNIVAFGPILPGREKTEHQPDEYIYKEDFELLRKIYREALLRLAQ